MKDYPTLVQIDIQDNPGEVFENDFWDMPRPFGNLAYVERGRGVYETPDGSFEIGPGEVLFIPYGGTYRSRWQPPPYMRVFRFDMPQEEGKVYQVQVLKAAEGDREDFRAATQSRVIDWAALEGFYRVLGRTWPRLRWKPRPPMDQEIRKAVAFVEKHCAEALTVEAIAREAGLSGSHLHAKFKAQVGLAPIAYKQRALIMRAQRAMLMDADKTISEVAYALGFASETYFRRVFKAITGLSPREWRRRGMI